MKIVLQAALNSRVHLGTSEPSQDKGQLKRNVRQADEDTDVPSATEILTNALTEIIERTLVSYMNCNKNEYNHTEWTLKPGPKERKEQRENQEIWVIEVNQVTKAWREIMATQARKVKKVWLVLKVQLA